MRKLTLKNTKQEILDAYVALEKTAANSQTSTTTSATKPAAKTSQKTLNMNNMVTQFESLKNQFTEASSQLQQQLVEKVTELHDVHQQTQLYITNLKELHQVEVGANSLHELIATYEITAEKQQYILTEEQKVCAATVDEQKQQWLQQQQQHQSDLKEAGKERKKQRQRDEQEYIYEQTQQEQKDADAFQQQQKGYQAELALLEEDHKCHWQEQETALAKQEEDAKKVTEQAENLEQELEQAIKKAEEEGYGIAKLNAKNKANLLQKEYDGQEQLLALKIDNLNQTMRKQATQIEDLNKQLSVAAKQAQDLAVKALEGTANASSFEAINAIALEQAKHSGKGK